MKKRNKPNLLFVFTDEQTACTMTAYGNQKIHTPNMDRLAEQSIVFEHAYVTQPVCTPSRASLLTGLYPHTHGCVGNNIPIGKDTRCVPEMGDFSGYSTGYVGKWHLGDEIFAQHGFQEWVSYEDGYRGYYGESRDKTRHSTYHDFLLENGFEPNARGKDGFEQFSRGFCARLPEQFGKPAYTAGEACRFIENHKEEPFLLYVNFLEPHMPYFGPRDNQYDPGEITLPPNFNHELTEDNPLKTRLFKEAYREYGHSGLPLRTEEDWRTMIAHYWGLVSLVDTHLGSILQTLDNAGLTDDTIIVFTSDHGDMMGSHRLLAKCVMFEEAVKVPLLMRIPGLPSGRVNHPVSQIDLVPTLLEALGQSRPSHVQGNSWVRDLMTSGAPVERDVFIEWNGNENGLEDRVRSGYRLPCWEGMGSEEEISAAIISRVRTIVTPDRWKYNWSEIGEDELYHLPEDPHETTNLAGDPAHADLVAALRKKIVQWQNKVGDAVFTGVFSDGGQPA